MIVWAKTGMSPLGCILWRFVNHGSLLGHYPWWPAVVFEEDDLEIPANVLASAPQPLHNGIVLVRFYEKKQKHNWYVYYVYLFPPRH